METAEKIQTEVKPPDINLKRGGLHTISVFVANRPGVLVRTALVFARRGFNIESLVVSPALDGHYSRMTITSHGDPETLDQIIKQVGKLIDVLHVTDHTEQDIIEKEMALIKLSATPAKRPEIMLLVDHFKAQTVDFTEDSIIIQVTGNTPKLDSFIEMLKKYDIIELVRTGKVVIVRGKEKT